MRLSIAVLPGDGIGPEVTRQASRVLQLVRRRVRPRVRLPRASDRRRRAATHTARRCPPDTLDGCLASDAVLLGAVGDPAVRSSAARASGRRRRC